MDLGPEQIRWIIQMMIILILSICVHEFGHAIVAHKLGDSTPKRQGRVTLNPISHADPIGTLIFPLAGLLFTKGASIGFGWGKPVMVAPVNFTRKFRMRTAHMFVALAGPMMNVLLGVFIIALHAVLLKTGVIEAQYSGGRLPGNMHEALSAAAFLNFILFFFNLIPAYPLDGGSVVAGLIPDRWVPTWESFSKYGIFVLFAVILIPGLAQIFVVPARAVTTTLQSLVGVL